MKKIMIIAALAGSLLAGQALAQTSTVDVTANASAACSSTTFAPINLGDIRASGGGGLNTAAVNDKFSASTANALCNGVSSTLSVSAPPLVGNVATPNGANAFTHVVNYTATLSLSGSGYASGAQTAAVTTNGNKASPTAPATGPSATVGLLSAGPGGLQVTLSGAGLSDAPAATFLVAGTYSSTVTLTFGAAP
jgi:hypothetical protein